MVPLTGIALSLFYGDLAVAHKENGSRFTLAWHNLFVLNQLALVSRHWQEFVYRYCHCDEVASVYALFAFGARSHKVLLLAAGRRNELPIGLRYSEFIDEVLGNLCAIAKRMLQWKATSPLRLTIPGSRSGMANTDPCDFVEIGIPLRCCTV